MQRSIDRRERREDVMEQKYKACVISIFWTILPCALAGGIIGTIFLSAFWYCLIGITVLSFFYCCLDHIPTRLFAGTMRGLSFWPLLKYGYASTDKRSSNYNSDEDWRYWFLYNSDHHKR